MSERTFRVVHRTEYQYGTAMADGFTVARLLPRSTPLQSVHSARIDVSPFPDEWEESLDPFGNRVVHFAVHHPHSSLVVESHLEVGLTTGHAPTSDLTWQAVRAAALDARGDVAADVAPFLAHTAQTPALFELSALTTDVFTEGRDIIGAVQHLCNRIFHEFQFDPSFSDVSTPLHAVLAERRGVCQDFAHVSCAALRSVGIPARYVSGYIETMPAPGFPKLVGVDASHAWCSFWAGELGWLDFDPTNNQLPPLRHVTVGWGRDYDDVAPVRGVVIGPPSGQSLHVSVDVAEQY
ncbi:MAG: transglutaminase family protein [Ilumatobacteraceae bacterium]